MAVDTRDRVAKELAALQSAEEAVLNLNYCHLRELPDSLIHSEHCRRRLRRLYLKRNLITTLVSLPTSLEFCDLMILINITAFRSQTLASSHRIVSF